MTARYLSRVRLRRDPHVAALAPVLIPPDDDARVHMGHRLVWTLFADGPDRRRDFLWREERPGGARMRRGTFYILSERLPDDRTELFEPVESQTFAPALAPGDRLGFSLRANPVVCRSVQDGDRRTHKRHDVAMDVLRALDGNRADLRLDAVTEAGRRWLTTQGQRHGFRLPDTDAIRVDGYDQVRLRRTPTRRGKTRVPDIRISVFDFDGVLEVVEPETFLAGLYRGFGRAKAFGCGLMLIRRV